LSAQETSLIGKRISHYLAMGRLGSGGTGVVYLARDLALGRLVALKLVPEDLEEKHKKRLIYEGRESARLQHPAIATFYEAGEEDGQIFLAMEYVRGQSLRQRLVQGPLEPPEAVSAAVDLLAAVSHAHFAGILHRDIKPENVILRPKGGLKLLDFGLALPIRPEDVKEGEGGDEPAVFTLVETLTKRTEVGAIVGTPGYMSPEQMMGEKLDARSDIFAIGAVLYEMLTGVPAFQGKTSRERMLAVFKSGPPPIEGTGVIPKLNEIVSKALERDRADRHASTARLLIDLQAACEGVLTGKGPWSLAVLDLRDRSTDGGDTWLDQGLAEGVTETLGRLEGVEVVPRSKAHGASLSLAGGDPTRGAIEAGQKLACRYVVSGEFQRHGDSITVGMRLLDVVTEQGLGEVTAEGKTSEFYQLRDRLCSELVRQLPQGSPDAPAPGAMEAPTPKVEAYKCFARARKLQGSFERGTFEMASELYNRALELDPGYAAPLAGLAYMTAVRYTYTGSASDLTQGAEYARRAIQLDPRSAQAYTALAYALWRLGELNEAQQAATEAMALASNDPWPFYFGGWILYEMGRIDEAIQAEQRALEIDPVHAYSWLALGSMQHDLDRLDEAVWCMRKAVESEGASGKGRTPGSGCPLAECLRRLGRLDEARAECMAALEIIEQGDHPHRDVFRCQALIILGRTALDQEDREGAQAAFAQAVAHARGRHRMSAGGHLLVNALAGFARATSDTHSFEEALQLFDKREGYDFGFMAMMGHESFTLAELAAAARALGLKGQAQALDERAREATIRWRGPPAGVEASA